jgi:hypothetical protein
MNNVSWWNNNRFNSGTGNALAGSAGFANNPGFGAGGTSGTSGFSFSPYLLNAIKGNTIQGGPGGTGGAGSVGNAGSAGTSTSGGAGGNGNAGSAGNPGNTGASGNQGTGATSGSSASPAPTTWEGKDPSLGVLGSPGDAGEVRSYNSIAVNRRGIYPIGIGTGTNSGSVTVSWNRTVN